MGRGGEGGCRLKGRGGCVCRLEAVFRLGREKSRKNMNDNEGTDARPAGDVGGPTRYCTDYKNESSSSSLDTFRRVVTMEDPWNASSLIDFCSQCTIHKFCLRNQHLKQITPQKVSVRQNTTHIMFKEICR